MGGNGRSRWIRRATACGTTLACLAAAPAAQAIDYAPVDRPGPPLSVPPAQLSASLVCSPGLASAATEPVLLVPGTGVTPEKNFAWNWIPALNALPREWCTVELPGSAMADIQVAGEHVVNAIRTMNAVSGREVDILGHSQGGMVPRWALRFWPDTRAMTDDVVGMAPSNHGTETAGICGAPGGCAPAFWQQRAGSEFIKALNSFTETFPGIDYTAIYTKTDAVVTPNLDETGSSSLRPGDGPSITNVAVQDLCVADPSDHLAVGTTANSTYALAVDAFGNPGPADPSRVPILVCATPLMPGVNPATFAQDAADAANHLINSYATFPKVPAEPALACYALASCASPADAAAKPSDDAAKRCSKGKGKKKRGASGTKRRELKVKPKKKRRGCKAKKRKRKRR